MKRISIILSLSLLFLFTVNTLASSNGKVAGYVTDKKTGEPLPGVNVLFPGTNQGAATDENGYYFIVNVRPGKYDLKAGMIGYTTQIVKDVLIMSDLTTTINFELSESVLELGEEVIVTSERPLIQNDITAKRSVLTGDDLTLMPVENITEALAILPGFTGGGHLRGGRNNEVAYMIDGVYISDPLYNTFNDLMIDKEIVEELVVMSGTFNAEYGNVMSGIVNIVTKDPEPEFHGQLEYLSPMMNESPYRNYSTKNGQSINDGTGAVDSPPQGLKYSPQDLGDIFTRWDQKTIRGQIRGNLSGGVPFINGLTFFLSGRYLNENSYLPFGYSLQRELMGKLVYKMPAGMKLNLLARQTSNSSQPYNHLYKYRPDNYSRFENNSNMLNLSFTHALSPNTFYSVGLSYNNKTYERKVEGKEVDIESLIAVEGGDTTVTPQTDYQVPVRWSDEFNYIGDDPYYIDEATSTLAGKFDLTSQVNKYNMVKLGAEFIQHKLNRLWFEQPWVGGIHQYQNYEQKPVELGAYIQDKIEFEILIINVGLRLDYFNPKAEAWANLYDPGFLNSEGNFEYYKKEQSSPKWQISPRIGMAHPVTDEMVLHFAYGHFFQRPDYRDLYYSNDIINLPYFVTAGNPNIDAQSTDQFEVGIKQQIGDYYAIDVATYFKVINNLAGSSYQEYFPYIYSIYDNSDYASVKGIEISIEKRYSHYFSGNLNYTWQIAMGNENSAAQGGQSFWGSTQNRLRPRQEYPLDWDRRHTFGFNLNLYFPGKSGPEIFGIHPFSNLGINILAQVKSGVPYTPQVVYYPDLARTMIRNSANLPWTSRIDMQVRKDFDLFELKFAANLKITNLLNTRNVVAVYSFTGEPWDSGPSTSISQDYERNPSHYEAPRQIRLGLSMKW